MLKVCVVCIGVLLAQSISGATLSDLIRDLRRVTGEEDTTQSIYSDTAAKTWINLSQDKIAHLADYIEKEYEHTYVEADTFGFVLPADFKYDNGVNVWMTDKWEYVTKDPFFATESNALLYYVSWRHQDTAILYLKNIGFDQTIHMNYRGRPQTLTVDTSTCEVPLNLQPFIITEAVSHYLKYQKQFEAALAVQAQVRQDMGIKKQVEQ